MDVLAPIPPFGRYLRHLSGADFSLQANTEAAPIPGQFYVLRSEEVLLESGDFAAAEALYKDLCRAFWAEHLSSPDRAVFMASAWGLLGLNLNHLEAGAVVQEHGTPAERKRLEQLRGRARAMQRSAWKKRAVR